MSVLHLASLTWKMVESLDRDRTVPLLPVGALEAHGPHLPLETDVIIANAMARAGASALREHELTALVLPAVTYTAAGFAASFPGTVSVEAAAVTRVLMAIASSLARHGFKILGIANAHFDPQHLASIHEAVEQVEKENTLPVAFPDVTRNPWASRLTEEFKSGACHAGQYETSIVMAEHPDGVDEAVRSTLPPNPVSLLDAIRDGKDSFVSAGGADAYFGFPADSSAAEGRQTVEVLGHILAEAVRDRIASLRARTA